MFIQSASKVFTAALMLHSAAEAQENFNFQIISSSSSDTSNDRPVAFTASFENLWVEDRHPFSYPSGNEHWSPFVFATHSSDFVMWEEGAMATQGIELIAETGSTSILRNELLAQQDENFILSYDTTPMIPVAFDGASVSTGSLCADKDHPLVSSISMIAPSPDWFSGQYNLRLHDGANWYERIEMYVYPWDAGTEEGERYSLSNNPTTPQEVILPFMPGSSENEVFVSLGDSELEVQPVGRITFALGGPSQECSSASASSLLPATEDVIDTSSQFIIRVKKAGEVRLRKVNCSLWVGKRPSKRCKKMTRTLQGRRTGVRVQTLCPQTCMNK